MENDVDFSILEQKIFDLYHNGLSISEFEQWVYNTDELETLLDSNDYFLLISLNYRSKFVFNEIDNILSKYVDYGKFEKSKIINLLKRALSKDENIGQILIEFYYMYCNGYDFFEDLGLGYGLSCVVPPNNYAANSWTDLSDKDKKDLIESFYPQIVDDIKRALTWFENNKIIITGTKNDIDHWEYIDNRTPEEKKSKIWIEVKDAEASNKKKWWKKLFKK